MRLAAVARRPLRRIGVVREHAFALAFVEHDELRRVGVALQERVIDRSLAISSCSSAMKSAPSVPGRIGIHSSAIAE